MENYKYKIFGKTIQFVFADNQSVYHKYLTKQLSLYPKDNYSKDELRKKANVIVKIGFNKPFLQSNVLMKNPSNHWEINNGFIRDYGAYKVAISKKTNCFELAIKINEIEGRIRKAAHLVLSDMEFALREEKVGQFVFENLLVPLMYFDEKKCLIHSSGFVDSDDNCILVGGTGGVGKTSLEIELCKNRNFRFVTDDIAVVSNDGLVYPNLSFPKMYGYNVENNSDIKKHIFKDKSLFDKGAWAFRYYVKGADKVRRKISPEKIFSGFYSEKINLKTYYILIRKKTDQINTIKIDYKKAAKMSLYAIMAEYWNFNNHLMWHEFNCLARNEQPIIKLEAVKKTFLSNMQKVFETANCYMLEIPDNIEHANFVSKVSDIIQKN